MITILKKYENISLEEYVRGKNILNLKTLKVPRKIKKEIKKNSYGFSDSNSVLLKNGIVFRSEICWGPEWKYKIVAVKIFFGTYAF